MVTTTYSCTALVGTNKTGIIKPDEKGYYKVVMGALDFPNTAGIPYRSKAAKKHFESSSALMRRITKGQLRGEYGHPTRVPGMTKGEWLNRVLTIDEKQVAFHIRKLSLETIVDKDGRNIVAIVGEIKPSGPYGDILAKMLENPEENVAFSLRVLSKDPLVAGQRVKDITTFITIDYVNEPGLSPANKYDSPSLESISDYIRLSDKDVGEAEVLSVETGISLESTGLDYDTIRSDNGWKGNKLGSMNW